MFRFVLALSLSVLFLGPVQAQNLETLVTNLFGLPSEKPAPRDHRFRREFPQTTHHRGGGHSVMATYYGSELAGRRTASGERFAPGGLTAAHRSLPFGTRLHVTNPRTGRSVVVRINDRGPFRRGYSLDLAHGAARTIGFTSGSLQIHRL